MISWLVIAILVILIFLLIKARYVKHKMIWVIIIVVAGLLYAGYMFSISKADIDWNSPQGVETAVKLYLSWFVNAFQNAKSLTGQAVNQDWNGNISDQTPNGVNKTQEAIQKKFHK
ncbi:MAG TPA: hypothetical protein VI815_01600 [Candidatus Nanoarchaeia archaeon]|nr:hypothetical protein [Candidatus Nanoarchaeia archaeon]